MKLKTKFLLFLISVLTLSLLMFVAVTVKTYTDDKIGFVKEGSLQNVIHLAKQLSAVVQSGNEFLQDPETQELFSKEDSSDKFLIDENGKILLRDQHFGKTFFDKDVPENILKKINLTEYSSGVFEDFQNQTSRLVSYANISGTPYFVLQVHESQYLKRFLALFLVKIFFAFMAVASLALLFGFWVIARLTQGIDLLSLGADHFGQGNFSHRVKMIGSDEVAKLGERFNIMAQRIHNSLHLEEEKARLKMEVETAQKVQETLFLPNLYERGALQLAGFYEPATECGGDWWYYFEKDNSLWVCVGDVTGHGVGSAMLTSSVRSTFSMLQMERMGEPADVLEKLNRVIYETVGGRLQMTFFVLEIDLNRNCLRYANASHEFPAFMNKGDEGVKEVFYLMDSNGPRLGQSLDSKYQNAELEFTRDLRLMLFSDGLKDVINAKDKAYGEMRLIKSFARTNNIPEGTAKDRLARVLSDLAQYRQGTPLSDDLSLVCLDIPTISGSRSLT